jgi:polysaccharide biosynthesis/export protein
MINESRFVDATRRKASSTSLPSRIAVTLALGSLLSACALAPGQHMETPPALPETSNANGGTATNVQVPIVPIDLTLIQQMRAAQAGVLGKTGVSGLVGKPGPYKLGPGDVLQITVWDHPELAAALGQPDQNTRPSDAAAGFVVDSAGNIQFPYIEHPIHAAGRSADEVQRAVYGDLSKTFLKPQITVRVASYRASQVYIDGEVHTPGSQTINDIPMTLTEAINRAGGFSTNADLSHVVVTRDGKSYPINVAQMTKSGENPSNIMLRRGDLVHVDARDDNPVYVMGEVNKPTEVTPRRDGSLTLSDALSQAGQVSTSSADAAQLYVIRQAPGAQPLVYHLDASSPVSMLLANQFDLQPKDVVYVDNSRLVQFSRVLNLLLPAIGAGLTGAVLTK